MEWTRTPPTREGWYWYFEFEYAWPIVLRCWRSGDIILTEHPEASVKVDVRYLSGYWYGPIQEPEPPVT